MSELFSRRSIVAGAAASVWAAPALAAVDRFAALETRLGGRLGVAALDVATGTAIGHREGERFAMCSTFKAMAVAAALALVDRGAEHLDRFVAYRQSDLLPYAPVTREHVAAGGLRFAELCAAAIEYSDNTAANLVLTAIGGPAGWTGFVRSLGDASSRLDRTEPTLNTAIPGDPRDTTTPLAMLTDMKRVLLGKVLSVSSRDRLVGWMVDCQTGRSRLRAGLPASWRVADKTGTGDHGAANDIAVAWTPSGPIVIASYLSAERATAAERDAAHAEVARIVAESLRPHG